MTHLRNSSAIEDMGQDGRMAAQRRRRNGETPSRPKAVNALA